MGSPAASVGEELGWEAMGTVQSNRVTDEQRRAAARYVRRVAGVDCADLLDALGLSDAS